MKEAVSWVTSCGDIDKSHFCTPNKLVVGFYSRRRLAIANKLLPFSMRVLSLQTYLWSENQASAEKANRFKKSSLVFTSDQNSFFFLYRETWSLIFRTSNRHWDQFTFLLPNLTTKEIHFIHIFCSFFPFHLCLQSNCRLFVVHFLTTMISLWRYFFGQFVIFLVTKLNHFSLSFLTSQQFIKLCVVETDFWSKSLLFLIITSSNWTNVYVRHRVSSKCEGMVMKEISCWRTNKTFRDEGFNMYWRQEVEHTQEEESNFWKMSASRIETEYLNTT